MYKGFTNTELEMIETLIDHFQCTRQVAEQEMINYKKEQAIYYRKQGNIEVAMMIEDQLKQADADKLLIYPSK